MLDFLVLGIIPGTSIQLNFFGIMLATWTVLIIMLSISYMHYRLSRRKFQGFLPYLLRRRIRQIDRQQRKLAAA